MNMVKHSDFNLRPSMAGKQSISILDLLHWAFVRECAQLNFDEFDRVDFAASNYGIEHVIWQNHLIGCRVDGGGRSDPHPDAELVADAVMNLPEAFGGRRMALQIAELSRSGLHPEWRGAAKPSCRPVEWKNTKEGPHAKTDRSTVWVYEYRGKTRRYESRVCPVQYMDLASDVMAARRRYQLWYHALWELRTTFQMWSNLSCWTVSDEMPDRAPWQKTS